ncbi:MAG: AEC family transporter [Oscillospiraceae bacterium]|nr:AEC family transporter [Oscillospiraceae bacterium]
MFLSNMMIAAKQVVILYLLVAVGAVCDKVHLFTEKTAKACTDLLFYVITFCVIVQSFLTMDNTASNTKNLLIAIGCGMLMHLVAALISVPLFRKGDKARNAVFRYAAVFGNCGYMGLPLTNAVLGTQGVFFCSAVIVAFQVCAFTYGIYVMTADQEGKGAFDWKKILLNPGVIAVIVGLPLYFSNLQLPTVLLQPVQYLSDMNTPLAMLIFGTYLAHADFRTMLREKKIALVALCKLILLPLILLGFYILFGIRGTLLATLVLTASAPSANNTVMFAAKYDKDTGLAAQTVSAVSLISIVTMPAMIALAMSFPG